ncbi:MAG: glycosyltransferase [Mycetocola sp.]
MTSLKLETAGVYLPDLNARGGAERLGLVMALELARIGIQTTIFTHSMSSVQEIEADLGDAMSDVIIVVLDQPHAKPGRLQALRDVTALRSCAREIRSHRPDLFVNCDYKSKLPGCGRRNVFYCHFPYDVGPRRGGSIATRTYNRAAEAVERRLVHPAAESFLDTYEQIWANSEFTRSHVRTMWRREAEILYPPCEMLEQAEKHNQIVAVGRFQSGSGATIPHKSQQFLVDSFRELPELHREGWKLALVGAAGSTDQRFVEDLRRRSADLPITFHVNPTWRELTRIVARSTIFWHAQGVGGDAARFPNTQEHFGISTVEAMSAGAVPLVFGRAGPAEVVEPIEGIEPWQTSASLLEATRSLAEMNSAERSELAQRCVDRAHQFDRGHFRRRLADLADLRTADLAGL